MTIGPNDLTAALKVAKPGDVLTLAAGDHGVLDLRGLNFAAPGVVVEGAADARASLRVRACAGVTFRGLTLVADGRHAATVADSERVRIEDCHVPGDPALADGGDVTAIFLRDSRDVAVTGCDIANVTHGIAHNLCAGLEIAENNIHHLRGRADGIRGNSSRVRVTGNHGWSFSNITEGWHPDFIQFWTNEAPADLEDITVEANVWRQDDGQAVQGVFLGNNPGRAYRKVRIAANAIGGALTNGITVEGGIDPVVEGNLVMGFAGLRHAGSGKDVVPQIILRNCVGGRVSGNIAPRVNLTGSTGIVEADNETIPLEAAPDFSRLEAWLAQPPETVEARLSAALTAIRAVAVANRTSRRVTPWDEVVRLVDGALG